MYGVVALTTAGYVPYEVHRRNETEQVEAVIRANVQKLELPGLVDCQRNMGLDRTECTVDFRYQTVRPDLQKCHVEMTCEMNDSDLKCQSVIKGGVGSQCERALNESALTTL